MAGVTRRITSKVFDQEMRKRDERDTKRKQLIATLKQGSDLRAQAEGDQRARSLQRRNEASLRAAERDFGEKYEERVEFDRRKMRDEEQQAALARAISEKKRSELTWKNKVAQIAENDPGLRELQAQLKAAYMNQERAAQQEEKRLIMLSEAEREHALDAAMERDRQMALSELAQKEEVRKQIAQESRGVLDAQIRDRERRLAEDSYQSFLKDKQQVDEVMRKVMEEDRREREEKRRKQEETRAYVARFQEEHAERVAAKKRAEAEEERKIREYNDSLANRDADAKARKAAADAEAERVYKEIEARERKKRLEKEEMENLRNMLHEEEEYRKRIEQDRQRELRRQRMKKEMIDANEKQKVFKAEVMAREAEAEKILVTKMLEKFEEDERRERENARRRIDAKKEYIAGIEAQRAHKRSLYIEEMEAEKASLRQAEEEEKFRQQVVQEARKRLLAEHAAKLQGFLPKGIIKSKEEWDYVQEEAAKQMAARQARY